MTWCEVFRQSSIFARAFALREHLLLELAELQQLFGSHELRWLQPVVGHSLQKHVLNYKLKGSGVLNLRAGTCSRDAMRTLSLCSFCCMDFTTPALVTGVS